MPSSNPNQNNSAPTLESTKTPTDLVEANLDAAETPVTTIPGSQYSTLEWILISFAVYSSALFYGLDTTIVAVVQGPVVERFEDVEKLGWLGIGFPLGSIATIAAWSKGYVIFDTKWMYIGSLVNFAAGSALCGGASDMNGLIVGRVWAGAGGAGMYLGQLNIWTQNTTLEKRSMYISGGGIIWGLGCILGPIIGGAFADSPATWRWAFYINLILFGLCSPVYFFVIHSHVPRPGEPVLKRLRELDWLGMLLNAGMYTTFVIGFAIGGTLWRWSDARTIATIIFFSVLLILFILQQYFTVLTTPEARIFPTRFLKSRTFLLLYVAQSCVQTALAIPIYYIPLIFQFARSESSIGSSLRLLPLVIVNIVTVFLNGALLPKMGYYMPWYFVSGVFNTVGGALFFATLTPETSTANIYGFSVLLALGTGLSQQAAYTVASTKAGGHVAEAIGFINNAQIGSVVVALTFTSLVFQNVGYNNVKDALRGTNFSDQDIRAALGGAKSRVFEDASLDLEVRMNVEMGIVEAIRWSFLLVLIAGVVGLGTSLGMKREKLFGKEEAVTEMAGTKAEVEEKKV
ncbi:major facilitator superfamily-domain-containing protein [Clohesyomyces aquaticus]|uniref:Major facilitator superfamily-domain-containing protein n=1 Tax=Clohesyomyces aquaticus TaxID=1231657 RepID=A0A1Y1ZZY0_9PLEO|nr:major facilitator superfamily-domain-containing protein [Clohesyomyces aquaticus]